LILLGLIGFGPFQVIAVPYFISNLPYVLFFIFLKMRGGKIFFTDFSPAVWHDCRPAPAVRCTGGAGARSVKETRIVWQFQTYQPFRSAPQRFS
jgi:hypothetical protein